MGQWPSTVVCRSRHSCAVPQSQFPRSAVSLAIMATTVCGGVEMRPPATRFYGAAPRVPGTEPPLPRYAKGGGGPGARELRAYRPRPSCYPVRAAGSGAGPAIRSLRCSPAGTTGPGSSVAAALPRRVRATVVLALIGLSTLNPEALAVGLSAAFRSDTHDGTSSAWVRTSDP